MFSETTRISLFFATYSFYPRLGIKPFTITDGPAPREAEDFATDIRKILDVLKAKTALA